MPTSRSRAAIDSWTDSGHPSLNHDQARWLRIRASGPEELAYWKPKIPAPRGATINVAELRFTTPDASGDTYDVTVQRIVDPWVESQINYNNAPSVGGGTASVTVTETTADTEWAIDVQSQVQAICNGTAFYGFRFSTTDTTERKLYSANALDNQPYLYVEWSDVPDAPTELSPSGGSAVTLSNPVFLFNFHDPVGDDMSALRLQINATNTGWTDDPTTGGFATPDFTTETDSPGGVASVDPEYDSSTGSFGGISTSATKWWTVQVQNAAGNWSKWSDPRSFTRTARGTLTLSSPTGGTVDDHTPTIIWGLSGATQTGWQVSLWDDSDPGTTIYDTGRRSGITTSHTIPKGYVTDETTTYRLRVRVWDDLRRVSTPGDKAHTEVVTTFVFAEGAPAAPSSATVAQAANDVPHAVLTWVRSSAPDYFVPVRNGKFLDELDPVDVLVSGTTYSWTDRTGAPNHDWEYKIRAKVSGVLGPARVATPDPFNYTTREIWLAEYGDPGSSRLVPVAVNLADCSFDMPENSGTYSTVDGDHVESITQSLKGLTGTVVGRIIARKGMTAANAVGDMLFFKNHQATMTLRMTLGAQNLRVKIRNVVLSPLATSDSDARAVRFDFASTDGPSQ